MPRSEDEPSDSRPSRGSVRGRYLRDRGAESPQTWTALVCSNSPNPAPPNARPIVDCRFSAARVGRRANVGSVIHCRKPARSLRVCREPSSRTRGFEFCSTTSFFHCDGRSDRRGGMATVRGTCLDLLDRYRDRAHPRRAGMTDQFGGARLDALLRGRSSAPSCIRSCPASMPT
jgi:hypothetical protein